MNSKDVIDIIETICDKLGIVINSFSDFVPELAKYKISSCVFWIVSSGLIILFSIHAIKFVCEKAKKDIKEKEKENKYCCSDLTDYPSVTTVSVISTSLMLIFLFIFLFNTRNLVVWISSPQASTVNYVLSYFK